MVAEGEGSVAAVAKHMTHSVATAQTTYQNIQGQQNSVKAYELIMGKRPHEEDGEEPDSEKKVLHSTEGYYCPRTANYCFIKMSRN